MGVDCEQTQVTSVSSFSLERSVDTKAVVHTLPSNFSPERTDIFPDLWVEDSWMQTAVHQPPCQHQHQELWGSHAKNNKTSM